jgi:hypothetical protein
MIRSLGFALLGVSVATATSAGTLTATKTYSSKGVESIRIDFAAGELDVVESETDDFEVTMKARCPLGHCEERARALRLVSERDGHTLIFRLDGQKTSLPGGPKVSLRFHVPHDVGVRVHMGAGDVDIGGVKGNVSLQLGAGDVAIRKPETTVRTVDVHVGVGDANLRVGPHRVGGRGFLSKHLRWSEGSGAGRVDVDLGAGDVTVSLD